MSSKIIGGIYFKEFNYFRTINTIGFTCGFAMQVGGIYLLSPEMDASNDITTKGSDDVEGAAESPPFWTQSDSSASSSRRGLEKDEEAASSPQAIELSNLPRATGI